MKCPDLEVLSRYADGESTGGESASVAGHVADCPSCRGAVAQFKEVGKRIHVGKPGGQCPSAEQLMEFIAGTLSDMEKIGVETHIADCRACLRDISFVGSETAFDAEKAGSPLIDEQRARAIVARLLHKPQAERVRSMQRLLSYAAATVIVVVIGAISTIFLLSRDRGNERHVNKALDASRLLSRDPGNEAEASIVTLKPRYTEGLKERVNLRYVEDGFVTDDANNYSIPFRDSVNDEYDQTILASSGGLPVAVKRTYRNASSPLLNKQTVTVTKMENGDTRIISQDPHDPAIVHPYAGPPFAALEETFAFALPDKPVRVGDTWTADGDAFIQLIGKATRNSLSEIKKCSMTCSLVQITKEKKARISLVVQYMVEHIQSGVVYEADAVLTGSLIFDIAKGRVSEVVLEGNDVKIDGYSEDSPSSAKLSGTKNIRMKITTH